MPSGFGRRYVPDPAFFRAIKLLRDAIEVYRAAQQPQIAARLSAELAAMEAAIAVQTEADVHEGTQLIKETLRSRLVREQTPGPHLGGRIRSVATPTVVPAGAIGYGDIDELDKAIDPAYPEDGTYWRAIEEGSDAQVGRILPGYFQPGFRAPAGSEFRQHPFFTPASQMGFLGAGDSAPLMRIQKSIDAKHFLRDGSATAAAEHDGNMRRIQSDAADALLAATVAPRTP